MRNDERIFPGLILWSLGNLFWLNVFLFVSFNMRVESSFYQADLATGRERQSTTGKRGERTKHDFRCSISRSVIGQASCLISRAVVIWRERSVSSSAVYIAQWFCIGRVSYFHCVLRLMPKGVWTRWLLYWDKRLIDLTLSWKSSR